MKTDNPGRLRIARNASAREQRPHLRGKAKGPAIVGRVQRLDAVEVAREEKAALGPIPNGKREHAAQPMYHPNAFAGVELQQYLGIGRRVEPNAGSLEFGT